MNMSRTTHIRINRDLLTQQREMFPEYTPNEIYKLGLNTIKGITKMNDFLYGKKKKK